MELIQRLLKEWSRQACGVTIDVVGDSTLSSELQWAIAFPLEEIGDDVCLQFLTELRSDLASLGLQHVDHRHLESSASLANDTAKESMCPYRPDTCSGDHLVATGRGLIASSRFMPAGEN